MRIVAVSWGGTSAEWDQLLLIAHTYCLCNPEDSGDTCSVHRMLNDQRVLDGLQFGRRLAGTLLIEEWEVKRKRRDRN